VGFVGDEKRLVSEGEVAVVAVCQQPLLLASREVSCSSPVHRLILKSPPFRETRYYDYGDVVIRILGASSRIAPLHNY